MIDPGAFLGFLSRLLTRVEVRGAENLKSIRDGKPHLIVVNHTTVVDVVVVIGMLHRLGVTVDRPCSGECKHISHIRPIGTSDIWNFPIGRQIAEGSGIIPTDQFDGRSAYRTARKVLATGGCVLIYPEGDVKVRDDLRPREWRPGAAGLVRMSGATVIPIAQHDSRVLGSGTVKQSIFRGLAKVVRPVRVTLQIGAPIDGEYLQTLSADDLTTRLEQALVDTWELACR